MTETWKIEKGTAGQRLDVFLAAQLKHSRSSVQRDIKAGRARVNGTTAPSRQLLEAGDAVEFKPAPLRQGKSPAPDLTILYEDEAMMVVDKPAGLLMHAGAGEDGPTVADFARQHTTDTDLERPGIVHRLDKFTSGAVVIAKSGTAKDFLQKQFAARQIKKKYLALLTGRVSPPRALIDLPLGRDEGNPLQQSVRPDGKPAQTRYEVIQSWDQYSLVEAWPETGRTHQIRVHFKHMGYPVAGDRLYGQNDGLKLARQFLHAAEISLKSPTGALVTASSPLPKDLAAVLDRLNSYNS